MSVVCPVCNDISNVHIVNTWIVGKKSFSCNGINTYEITTSEIQKIFGCDLGYRGSNIIILFEDEQCDHNWVKITSFHKGETTELVRVLTDKEIIKLRVKNSLLCANGMWRD